MVRYQQVFQQTDADHDGKLTGGELVPVLMSLNAPNELLKDIWALADTDKDGVLNFQEFIIAIYLTERAREGRQPPSSLPPGQFPPMAQGQQPQPQQPQAAQVPQSRGALDADLFSGGIDLSLPSISGTGMGLGAQGGDMMSGGAIPPAVMPPAASMPPAANMPPASNMPVMPVTSGISAPISQTTAVTGGAV